MSPAEWVAAGLLLGAAAIVAAPTRTRRSRWRAVLAPGGPETPTVPAVPGAAARSGAGPRPSVEPQAGAGSWAGPRSWASAELWPSAAAWTGARVWAGVLAAPRRLTGAAGAAGGIAGALVGGPVAGVVGTVYFGLAVHVALRRRARQVAAQDRRHRLDQLGALAADLRAGLPLPASTPDRTGAGDSSRTTPPDRIAQLVQAAGRLADRTGAPLADLLDRIEADARATDRGLAAAAAQSAGAQATAGLLALLPLGGIALGFGIGADPLHVLLRTPIGAACAGSALLLQLGGLAWTDRLNTAAARAR